MTPRQQFAAKLNELITQTKELAPAARTKVLELLDHARIEILGRLASVDGQSFTAAQLTSLKQSIEHAMDDFRRDATKFVDGVEQHSAKLGSLTASAPLVSAGLEAVALGQVNATTLAIAQGYTADLITNLSRTAANEINGVLQRAFLGGQSWDQIVQQIGKGLGATGRVSVFDAIGERATVIAQNEILRVHAMSTQARLEDLGDRHPDLKKAWKHLPAARWPRISHLLADGQVKLITEPFDIPPYPGAMAEQLMYPRDPNGTARNTINCHCMELPYFDAEALKPSAAQKGLLESLGISISAA